MINFEVDEPKKLLAIRYHGVVRAEETEKGLEQIRNDLAKLQRGFRLLADFKRLAIDGCRLRAIHRESDGHVQRKRSLHGCARHSRSAPRHRPANHVDLSLWRRCSNLDLRDAGSGDSDPGDLNLGLIFAAPIDKREAPRRCPPPPCLTT